MQWLAVALGGALGAMARYGTSIYLFPIIGGRFPTATLSINVLGSLLMGFFYIAIVDKSVMPDEWRPLIMAGFLGAFTTFSTFALDAVTLWQGGFGAVAIGYVVASIVSCILAVLVGMQLAIKLF
jgi:CrcB protein